MGKLEIVIADITSLKVDAIVNAANTSLLGGGGVDGAIHRAAGPQLLEATRQLGGCETGSAKITPGFNLPSKWVIHAVGPVYQNGHHQEAALLYGCYQTAFNLAKVKHCRSIAFPAISTGIYGYPKREAAQIALKAMNEHLKDFDLVIACFISEQDKEIFEKILEENI
ncbi:MAG: O-acetyl-ADP-ribose deacetylase [Candidatus Berkiellales bacterium]